MVGWMRAGIVVCLAFGVCSGYAVAQDVPGDAGLSALQAALSSVSRPVSEPQVVGALSLAHGYMGGDTISPHSVWLLVDRNPSIQRMWVMARLANGQESWIASIPVSTGKPGRREHYKTAVGVFHYDGNILGYRAQGTKNENGIRGIGVRGERVWDMGWQTTEDWHRSGDVADIRMAMHATDPDVLAPRLGHWDSEGCIRIPAAAESAFDRYGVLDKQTWALAQAGDRGWGSMLARHVPDMDTWLGDTLVVVDSATPHAIVSDPEAAAARESGG